MPKTKSSKRKSGSPLPVKSSTRSTVREVRVATTGKSVQKTVKPRVSLEDRFFAGIHHKTRRLATIREVLASTIPTRTGRDLSLAERVRLSTRRIKENNNFVSMMMLGVTGVIDKKRALREIKELSAVGLQLLGMDMQHAQLQIEQSLTARAKRRKNGSGNDGRN